MQHAKKVLSSSLELEDFAIGRATVVISLPVGQVKFFENSNYRRTVYSTVPIKNLLGLVSSFDLKEFYYCFCIFEN